MTATDDLLCQELVELVNDDLEDLLDDGTRTLRPPSRDLPTVLHLCQADASAQLCAGTSPASMSR